MQRYGIVERMHQAHASVWFDFDLMPTKCEVSKLAFLNLPDVPAAAYTETSAVIGGIGKHVRWEVIFPNKKIKGEVALNVGNIRDRAQFTDFVRNVIRPFGLCRFEFDADAEGTNTTIVTVPDAQNISMVASALHCAGFTAVPSRREFSSGAKLAIERYDRSEHMWWNQTQEVAGPLRDVHRWVFDFLPTTWKHIPFTWQSLCHNIHLDPETESKHLPLPLRDFYLSMHIEESTDDAQRQRLANLRGRPSVTCRLSQAQNRQLLAAAYWSTIAPFDNDAVLIGRLLRFRYMLNGYTSREIGGYNQTAKHLGHGAKIRIFRNKPQYRRENLSTEMLNQIYKSDGSLRGSGFKGTRGKYGHRDFPRYKPAKRMKRSVAQEDRMRASSTNVFDAYRRVAGQSADNE